MISVLMLGILFLSLLGYFVWLKCKFDIHEGFVPIVTMAGIGSLMYIAGLLNFMPLMVGIILLFGLIQLRYLMALFKSQTLIRFCVSGVIFLGACSVLLLVLRDNVFGHYDNFSHWAVVVKEMLSTDHLPNFQSEIITFYTYPTGTAGFIYYVCKIIGVSEGKMAFAQALILTSCIFTLIAFVRRRNWPYVILVAAGSFYLLNINVAVTELLVDTVLPLLCFSTVAIVYYYRNNIYKAVILNIPITVFITITKDSGLFFMAVTLLCSLYIAKQQGQFKKLWIRIVGLNAGIPLSMFYLWKCHVAYVFPPELESKHDMSLNTFSTVLQEKTPEDIRKITSDFLKAVFSFENEAIKVLIYLLVLLLIGTFLRYGVTKKAIWKTAKIEMLCVGVYLTWMASLYTMYMLSMPLYEALQLAAFSRYNETLVVFLYALMLLGILICAPKWKKKCYVKNAVYVLCCVTVILITVSGIKIYEGPLVELRREVKQLKEDNHIKEGESYFLYLGDLPYTIDSARYVLKYEMSSADWIVCDSEILMDNAHNLKKYKYWMICEDDELMDDVIEQYKKKKTIICRKKRGKR